MNFYVALTGLVLLAQLRPVLVTDPVYPANALEGGTVVATLVVENGGSCNFVRGRTVHRVSRKGPQILALPAEYYAREYSGRNPFPHTARADLEREATGGGLPREDRYRFNFVRAESFFQRPASARIQPRSVYGLSHSGSGTGLSR